MALRLNGMVSGMDTESIVTELMKAQRLKTTKIQNKITRSEWTKDKWKSINSKLYSFYTGSLSKMRLQGNFSTKKAVSSNEGKVDIKANSTAPEGNHSIKVQQLASAQFATGSVKETDIYGKAVTLNTKLIDMGFIASEGTTITIDSGEKTASVDIGSSTTINDFISALKNGGLNANYDTTQKRFFISSKESGIDNAFSIETSSTEQAQDRNAIRDFLAYGSLSTTKKDTVDKALNTYIDSTSTAESKATARTNLLTISHEQARDKYIKAYVANQDNIDAATISERERLEAELPEGETLEEAVLKAAVNTKLLTDGTLGAKAEYDIWKAGTAPGTNVFEAAETGIDTLLTNYSTNSPTVINQTNTLSVLGINEIVKAEDGTVSQNGLAVMKLVEPSDAKVIYNGAELTSSSNTISANGLTFTVKGITSLGLDEVESADDEIISLSVSNDTQAVYDMVKGFVKSYNEIIKEMNESYNAVNAKGFEPLTDDEKESMSESQIDKWEDKIKDSLLRRDSTLNSLVTTMRTSLNESVVVDGKKYSLTSFGVGSANYTDKGLLHIDGDADDSLVSALTNKLMDALNEDPDKVMKVFTELTGKLYDTMTDKMSSTSMRSALTFYNDKEITKDITSYQINLKKLEGKLQDMEDRYYKQFAAMETAMAKMNSQSSSLMAMMGNNQQ